MKLTLKVVSKPKSWASANEVVDEAIRVQDELRRDEDEGEELQDSVWVLLDLEGTAETTNAAEAARDKAVAEGINVALSRPCYELWTLLHFEDTGKHFADCSAVIERLKQQWRRAFNQEFGKKAQADYAKLLPNCGAARDRAKRHREQGKDGDPSWTEVYLVVENLKQLAPDHSFWKECGWKGKSENP